MLLQRRREIIRHIGLELGGKGLATLGRGAQQRQAFGLAR